MIDLARIYPARIYPVKISPAPIPPPSPPPAHPYSLRRSSGVSLNNTYGSFTNLAPPLPPHPNPLPLEGGEGIKSNLARAHHEHPLVAPQLRHL